MKHFSWAIITIRTETGHKDRKAIEVLTVISKVLLAGIGNGRSSRTDFIEILESKATIFTLFLG